MMLSIIIVLIMIIISNNLIVCYNRRLYNGLLRQILAMKLKLFIRQICDRIYSNCVQKLRDYNAHKLHS